MFPYYLETSSMEIIKHLKSIFEEFQLCFQYRKLAVFIKIIFKYWPLRNNKFDKLKYVNQRS